MATDNELATTLARVLQEAGVRPEQLLAGLLRAAQEGAPPDGTRRIQDLPDDAILRVGEVQNLLNCSRTTLWRLQRRGKFPEPVRLTPSTVGWRLGDVRRFLAELGSKGR